MKLSATGLLLSILLSACGQDTSISNEEFNIDNLYGTWRIDSTAENGSFNKRKAVNEEFFVFEKDRTVKMKAIEGEAEKLSTLGTFEIVSDTLKITTLKGAAGMDFILFIKEDFIQLNGTFPIADDERKPTLFLSRR